MHKPEYGERCLRYLAGELPAAEAEGYRTHRADCAECAELERALGGGTRAAARAAVSLSAAARKRLADKVLAADEPAAAYAAPWRVWALGAALAALAVGLFVARPHPPAHNELAWTNGIERDIRRLDGALAGIDDALELGEVGDIDLELEGLERESRRLRGEFKGG